MSGGSEEHAAEVESGRPWFMVDRAEFEGRKPLPSDESAEWPEGWVEIGATTDNADLNPGLFRK
jgi:hypothetical protein